MVLKLMKRTRRPAKRGGQKLLPGGIRLDGALNADLRSKNTKSWAEHRWHQLDVNRYPLEQAVFDDIPRLIREYAAVGYAPPEPVLGPTDPIITLGSCFALELRNVLREAGFPAGRLAVPAGLNNTYGLLDFVSWVVTGEETERGFRYDRFDEGEIREWKPEEEREAYRSLFAEAGAFIFSFGLAEVWQDRETGGVFWRGVPDSIFDADRHVFRLTTVEENVENISRIVGLVREVNERAPIVLTLSPVPAKATFRDISCISADCVSKSLLRVALDQVLAGRPAGVYYWPGFEIVKWGGPHLSYRAYGFDTGKPRQVTRYLVSQVIDAFIEAFYTPDAVAQMRARQAAEGRKKKSPASLAGKLEGARSRRRKTRVLAARAKRNVAAKAS